MERVLNVAFCVAWIVTIVCVVGMLFSDSKLLWQVGVIAVLVCTIKVGIDAAIFLARMDRK